MPRPSLKQRKDGRYACRYKNKFFYGSTQAEAYAARDRYKREEASAKYETVEDYALRWLPIAHPAVSEATMTGLRIHLNKLINQIGHMALSEVLPTDIKTIYSTCYKDASSSYPECQWFESTRSHHLKPLDSSRISGFFISSSLAILVYIVHKGMLYAC